METWAVRSSRPGVIRAENFADWTQARLQSYSKIGDARLLPPNFGWPRLDSAKPAPGSNTSIRITYPRSIEDPRACAHPSASGTMYLPFRDDGSIQFGANSEFWVQWLLYMGNDYLHQTPTQPTWARQWPQKITSVDYGPPFDLVQSCGDSEIVATVGQYGFPFGYHSCGVKDNLAGGGYQGFDVQTPQGIFYQNAMPMPSCRYPDLAGCKFLEAERWMAFKIHVKIGNWYHFSDLNYSRAHQFEMWYGRVGVPLTKVISRLDYDYTWEIGAQVPWDSPQRTGTRVTHTATGGQTVFPFGFPAFNAGNIVVRHPQSLGGPHQLPPFGNSGIPCFVQGVDYTVTLNSNGVGGLVTFASGRTAGQRIEITRLLIYGKLVYAFAYDNVHLRRQFPGGPVVEPLECDMPHPELNCWYGNVIISSQDIEDPADENAPPAPHRRTVSVGVTLT